MSDRPNKHRQRTQELNDAIRAQMINDIVVNDIEQHNFDKLIQRGIIVREEAA